MSERTGVNEETGAAAPRSWDETSAAAWDKWFHIIEGGARALSDRMIALAAIGPGARVLDVASGLGDPTVPAARRAGPSGHVLATDLSDEMLGYGRKRAAKLGLANIEFRQMDGQALEVPEAAFERRVAATGFEEVRGEWVNVPFTFESAEQSTQFRRERSKPLNQRIAGFPAAAQEAAWAALTEATRAFETLGGTVRLDNAAYCVSARS